ncbi:MAG TPA: protein kinase [Oculatellaceae cyanobacterium]
MKLCLRCNQYFEDMLAACPADNSTLEAVGDNPLIGALINDRYVVDSVIGKGSSGIVYKATRLLMQREVAVKVLHSYLGAETGSLDRFLREARAAARLKHPHIINIWESGVTDDGQPYFVMDYLEGHTLAELVKEKGALPLRRVLPIVRQICEALSEAHRQSIVHRDIKPENIVLQESDYAQNEDFVKVLDFGIADQATGAEGGSAPARQRTAAGSPAYMSPEQCQGFQLDARSDIYSLAIVVFELMTGTRPFEAEDIMTLFRMHVKTPPPSLSQTRPDLKFPVKLEMAVNKALSKDPNQRHQDVLSFCKDVEEGVEAFLLESINQEGYGLPGTGRDGKAISTLVLDADGEDDSVPSERLTEPEPAQSSLFQAETDKGGKNGGMIATPPPAAPQFALPSKPSTPGSKPTTPESIPAGSATDEDDSQSASSSSGASKEEAEAASRLMESAKRASQSFKSNLSNSGKEDVSDWARQILQRKSNAGNPVVKQPDSPENGAAKVPAASAAQASAPAATTAGQSLPAKPAPPSGSSAFSRSETQPSGAPRITPVAPVTALSDAPTAPTFMSPSPSGSHPKAPFETESEQKVSDWARQILKRNTGESSAKMPFLRKPSEAQGTEPLLAPEPLYQHAPEVEIPEPAPVEEPKDSAVDTTAEMVASIDSFTTMEALDAQPEPETQVEVSSVPESVTGTENEAKDEDLQEETVPLEAELKVELEVENIQEVLETSESTTVESPIQEVALLPELVAEHGVIPEVQEVQEGEVQNAEPQSELAKEQKPEPELVAPAKQEDNPPSPPTAVAARVAEEVGKLPASLGKMSIQDAIDAQRKETGKFSTKDIEAWGAMMKKASAASGKTGGTPEGVNVLPSKSASNLHPSTVPSNPATNPSTNPVTNPVTNKERFEAAVNKDVSPSTKFAKEVEKVLDAAIVKPGEQAHKRTESLEEPKGKTETEHSLDANRFEQPINKRTEVLNPFAREVEKVIDSAIIKGRRPADDTGMMKSISFDQIAEATKKGANPASFAKKELGKAPASTGGPDVKKILSRRRADNPSNLLGRAQEALKSGAGDDTAAAEVAAHPDATSMSTEIEEAHVISHDAEVAAIVSLEREIVDVSTVEEVAEVAEIAEFAPAMETTPAETVAPAAMPYSKAELDAIGRFDSKAKEAATPPVVTPPPSEEKVPIRLDKMRSADPRKSQPGFGDKLKSMFGGTKSGMAAAEKEKEKKGTKSGLPAAGKDKDKPESKDKNTKTGIPAAADLGKSDKSGKEKGTKSGLAAIGAFFGGNKNKDTAHDAVRSAKDDSTAARASGFDANATGLTTGGGIDGSQYAGQPASFVSGFKPATPEFKLPESMTPPVETAPVSHPSAPTPSPVLPAESVTQTEQATSSIAAEEGPSSGDKAELSILSTERSESSAEPNDFERAVAEALAQEEARMKAEQEEDEARLAERKAREAAAAARAMAEIEAQEKAQAEAKAQEQQARFAQEAQEREERERAEQEQRAKEERERAEREEAEAVARRAEQEAAEAAARRAEQEAAEAAARARAEQEAAESAARARAEQEAAEAAARARAEKEAAEAAAKVRAEQEAAEAAARVRAEKEAAEAGARVRAEQEAAEAAARARAEEEAATASATGPEIVDTPSKLGAAKANQAQLANMLNRFAKKANTGNEDAPAVGLPNAQPQAMIPQAAPLNIPTAPIAQAPAHAPGAEEEDPAVKSQRKFAELAQRLKANAANRAANENTGAVPAVQQPAAFTPPAPQGEFGASTFNNPAGGLGAAGMAAAAGLGAAIGSGMGNLGSSPISPPSFGMPEPGAAAFTEGRMADGSSEPVKPEALNKKIEAVKKKIEALKAGGIAQKDKPEEPRVFEEPPKPSLSTSSPNMAGGPPVNRLLEAAQRAVETGSVSRLPAQKGEPQQSREAARFEPPRPLPPKAIPPEAPAAMASSEPAMRAAAAAAAAVQAAADLDAKRKEAAAMAGVKDSYSSFRNIEQSIKTERTKGQQVQAPNRARVRQSFNKPRIPVLLIVVGCTVVIGGVLGFGPLMKSLPQLQQQVTSVFSGAMHPTPTKSDGQESNDIDELIQSGKLERARAILDRSTKTKWTQKDADHAVKIAEKYAQSDPPEYDAAIDVLNKIPRKGPSYRKAQKMVKNYTSLKRRAGSR